MKKIIVLIAALGLFVQCNIQNPADEFNLKLNVNVSKPLFSGGVNAQPTEISIAKSTVISKAAAGKRITTLAALPTDFIQVPIYVPSIANFLAILEDETAAGGNFVGTLINRATNDVTVGIYLSHSTGLSDPWNDAAATFIASLTLPAAANETTPADPVLVDSPDDFDVPASPIQVTTNMISFFVQALARPTDPIIVYVTAKTPGAAADEKIDILVENLSLLLPAEVEISNMVSPGDLDNYSKKIQEVTTAKMSGTITNNGAVAVRFFVYLFEMNEVLDKPKHVVVNTTIPGTSTLDFSTSGGFLVPASPPYLSGQDKLFAGIDTLQAGHSLKVFLHVYSTDVFTPIAATINNLELESDVTIEE